MMNELKTLQEPLRVALIGAGRRAWSIYRPLFSSLTPWIKLVAICDPVKEHADRMAGELGVPAFYDVHELVRSGEIEAAVVVTPADSHHAVSVYLSSHGIHNLIETPWCNTMAQARQMIETARQHNVVVRVGENFFRAPIDRFAQVVRDSGYIGKIRRIFSYADHTGYHNDSRWTVFAKGHPLWVQSIEHTIPTAPFLFIPERFCDSEEFKARYFMFPDNLMVIDQAANIKGLLGRHPRPGYTEWQGERGTLVHRADYPAHTRKLNYFTNGKIEERIKAPEDIQSSQTELRFCSDDSLKDEEVLNRVGGMSNCISPVVDEFANTQWVRTYAETPAGLLEYVNLLRPERPSEHFLNEYGTCVMGHIVDFALAVRGVAESEFTDEDALMSMMMEIGAHESALQDGRRIKLPLEGELEYEELTNNQLRTRYGVDPLDVEGMLRIGCPTV